MMQTYIASPVHGSQYLLYRPKPPVKMISRILDYLGDQGRSLAVDVGCGSGQSTSLLAPHFQNVVAVDFDKEQIKNAETALKEFANITLHVCGAEHLPVDEDSVDLITAVQCAHWFNLKDFYEEVRRVLRPGGVLALACYGLPRALTFSSQKNISPQILQLFNDTFGEYVPEGSRIAYIENYSNEPFKSAPFSSQPFIRDTFESEPREVQIEDLLGYIRTWSTYQRYIRKNGEKAAEEALHHFATGIPVGERILIAFPYFLLLCRKG